MVKELGDKVKEPLDEFKVGVMYFKKEDDRQWRGEQYEDIDSSSGEFPNQKVKMDTILSNTIENRKLFERDEESIKYFHFPANHMGWIETAITRYYEVNRTPTEEDPEENENQLLSFEHWRGQLHGSGIGKDLFHLRHMRPRCAHVSDHTDHNVPSHISLFLPYLHWETNRRRAKMVQIVQELVEDNKVPLNSYLLEAAREAHCLPQKFDPQVWDAMDYDADERLLRQGFSETKQGVVTAGPRGAKLGPPLHIRRTLDQSYFSVVEDTVDRDTDQVVYRQTRARKERHEKQQENEKAATSSTSLNTTSPHTQHVESTAVSRTLGTRSGSTTSSGTAAQKKKEMTKLVGVTRVVMVDQLWMWILGEDTIVTSFPRRWGRNKPDSSGVHKSLRQILGKRKRIRSIYHLATLIIDQCSKVFFDRTQPTDDRPEVMDLFAQAIGTVAYNTTSAYSLFWANISLQSSNMEKEKKHKTADGFKEWLKRHLGINPERSKGRNRDSFRYLNINPEGVLLKESQDITDELNMMERIYKQQLTVVNELQKHIKSRHDKGQSVQSANNWSSCTLEDLEETSNLAEKVQNRIDEIADFQKAVTRTTEQLQALLSLKQQEASIVEARIALERADESVQQGRAIMAFTIITIFFLPLGFFTGFFGMNNRNSTGDEWMSMREQIMYMFVISAAVISVVLIVAFRWGSDKPNKRVSLDVAIDRHHKEQENKRKINSQSSNNVTGWLDNRAGVSRRRGNQSAISEV
ncbi:corA-like mg2+ transporter protein domain-containing protein [Trichoderma breve]|uniref:CorA-like mg2+ transporter protein domain-containing protein n=1 Tax=Trichoderma breve TaxID=2034170 RepID=A0A9W9EEB9_9HYPO|nr:corA-like mg2+ transporter protein domain-containing protein [Trichoderma breve]KAJ4865084.1 corA-like mg2+ transporter protein domain-containing protein [Trichoderma breve]